MTIDTTAVSCIFRGIIGILFGLAIKGCCADNKNKKKNNSESLSIDHDHLAPETLFQLSDEISQQPIYSDISSDYLVPTYNHILYSNQYTTTGYVIKSFNY